MPTYIDETWHKEDNVLSKVPPVEIKSENNENSNWNATNTLKCDCPSPRPS